MKILKFLPLAVGPVTLMLYGWFLGQLRQSADDIAGVRLFLTGTVGLVLGVAFRWLTRKFPWAGAWYLNLLYGLGGCGVVFVLIFLFARFLKMGR